MRRQDEVCMGVHGSAWGRLSAQHEIRKASSVYILDRIEKN